MFIRSERLFLRPGWDEDWQEVLEGIAEEVVVRNLATAPWPYRADDARAFAARPQDPRFPHFLVTLPTPEAPARVIGCIGLQDAGGAAEIGYWIARESWGQGFATEAVRAVLGLASTIGHRRVIASHFADNPASGTVLAKAGFAPTGVIRPRFSAGRGGEAPAVEYAVELAAGLGDGVAAMAA